MGPLWDPDAPQGCSPSQEKEAQSHKVKHAAKNWQLSGPVQELLSSSELKTTIHDVFTEHGRERVCVSCFAMQY